jgi:ribosomal protein L33
VKEIEGVSIKTAVEQAQAQACREATDVVARQIKEMYTQRINARQKIARLELDLDKSRAALRSLEDKILSVEAGDWKSIPDVPEQPKA